jgi:hypothetical protein
MRKSLAAPAALAVLFGLVSACAVLNINTIRKQFFAEHADVTPAVRQAIMNAEVRVGMTEQEVVAAIGYPLDINRSTGSWGTTAQFCYESMSRYIQRPKYTYVYFENGRVTSWQQ